MENKIISLDLNTKIQYSLFNFFTPIVITGAIINSAEAYNIESTKFAFLSIFIGLFFLINNITKYNRYIIINDDSINVCTGKKNPKVLEIIKKSQIEDQQIDFWFMIETNGKKIKLLHILPSIICLICWLGPLFVIPILKILSVFNNNASEIKALLPELVESDINPFEKKWNILINILMWGFALFISAVGCLSILLAPFYAYFGNT